MSGKAKELVKHKKKMAAKRSAKTAKRQLYASLAGSSKKNKKQTKHAHFNQFSPKKHRHLMENCGNPGCKKCGVK